MKSKLGMILVFGAIFALGFLLLRENEGRTAAEEKLRDMQFKVDSLSSEKENVIAELETRVGELEAELKSAEASYNNLIVQAEEASLKHEASLKEKSEEMAILESRSREEAAKRDALLKEKNAEITDLGQRLQDASAKMANLLKKIEELESKNLACEKKSADLEADLRNFERRNARLAELVKDSQKDKSPSD